MEWPFARRKSIRRRGIERKQRAAILQNESHASHHNA